MAIDLDQINRACLDAFARAPGEPGAVAAYVSLAGGALTPAPRGDFRNQALDLDGESTVAADAGVASRQPMLGLRLAEFPEGVQPAEGDRVTIATNRGADTYRVIAVDDNGEGHAWLRLHLA